MDATPTTIRIFISSPGDVQNERDQARRVIAGLERHFREVTLRPVLWEDLALPATASFQETIDFIIEQSPVDIAVFILWSRLGTPLGPSITRPDGTAYRSGTEREFDLMLAAHERSGQSRPVILAYLRKDDTAFKRRLTASRTSQLPELIEQRKAVDAFVRERFYDDQGRNARALQSYADPGSFAQRLRTHLRQILYDLLGTARNPHWLEAPYRGLQSFSLEHATIFHGRDEEACDVLQRLREQSRTGCAFAVIIGPSGSGKSSLACAGVAASLVQHAGEEDVSQWLAAVLFPTVKAGSLAMPLAQILSDSLPGLAAAGVDVERLATGLWKEPDLAVALTVLPALASASKKAGGAVRLIIVLDQMEELWTDSRIGSDDRRRFLLTLEALARCGSVAILATLRSDFYSQAQQMPEFLRLKGEHGHYDLLPPSPGGLSRLITEPARLAGLRFETDHATGRSLDQVILRDAAGNPSALPLIQYTLDELYRLRDTESGQLSFAAYDQLGGVEGALGKRAEELMAGLPEDSQRAFLDLLPLLITVDVTGEQVAARRRVPQSELRKSAPLQALTDTLIQARFLTTGSQAGIPTATLAHEALLQNWQRVADWITANREHLRIRSRVEHNQKQWEQQGRDASLLLPAGLALEEGRKLLRDGRHVVGDLTRNYIATSIAAHEQLRRREHARRRAVVSALATLAALAVIAATIAGWQAQRARSERLGAQRSLRQSQQNLAKSHLQGGVAQLQDGAATAGFWDLWRGFSIAADHDESLQASALNLMAGWSAVRQASFENRWNRKLATFSPDLDKYLVPTDGSDYALWIAEGAQTKQLRLAGRCELSAAAFSPNGLLLITGDERGTVGFWDATSGKLLREADAHQGAVLSVVFDAAGTKALSASTDGTAKLWNTSDALPLPSPPIRHKDEIVCAAFHPDGDRVVTGGKDYAAKIWHLGERQSKEKKLEHMGRVVEVTFSPDGQYLATASDDGTVHAWNVASGEEFWQSYRASKTRSLCWAPSPNKLATGDDTLIAGYEDGAVVMWNIRADQPMKTFPQQRSAVLAVAIDRQSRQLAAALKDGRVHIWQVESQQPVVSPLRHQRPVRTLAFTPDGLTLVTSCDEGTIRHWRLGDEQPAAVAKRVPPGDDTNQPSALSRFEAHVVDQGDRVTCVDFSSQASVLATGGRNAVRLWKVLPSGVELRQTIDIGCEVNSLAFHPSGRKLLTGGESGMVNLIDLDVAGSVVHPIPHSSSVWPVGFSASGEAFYTGDVDGDVRLWDTASRRQLGSVLGHSQSPVWSADFGDRDLMVTGCEDERVHVWDVAQGKRISSFYAHGGGVWNVAFHPFRDIIASAGGDHATRLWTVEGKRIGQPMKQQAGVWSVRFNDSGDTLLTASWDRTSQLWDVNTCLAKGPPLEHFGGVTDARFANQGDWVVTASWDGLARIWNVSTRADNDPERIRLWIELQSGSQLDAGGMELPLSYEQWLERKTRLAELGGSPFTE